MKYRCENQKQADNMKRHKYGRTQRRLYFNNQEATVTVTTTH